MKHGLKSKLAAETGLSNGFISRILSEKDPCKPSWDSAKKLGRATNTDPVLWADKNLGALKEILNSQDTEAA